LEVPGGPSGVGSADHRLKTPGTDGERDEKKRFLCGDAEDDDPSHCDIAFLDFVLGDVQSLPVDVQADPAGPAAGLARDHQLPGVVQSRREQSQPPVEHVDDEHELVVVDGEVVRTVEVARLGPALAAVRVDHVAAVGADAADAVDRVAAARAAVADNKPAGAQLEGVARVHDARRQLDVPQVVTARAELLDPVQTKKVKFSRTRYRALGPELIPVYRQSARR